jgi:hypothetical protein
MRDKAHRQTNTQNGRQGFTYLFYRPVWGSINPALCLVDAGAWHGTITVTYLPQVRRIGPLPRRSFLFAHKGVRLFCELPQHEISHDVAGLDGFRQGRVIPERMRKRVEEYEACIDAGAQLGAM